VPLPADFDRAAEAQEIDDAGLCLVARNALALAAGVPRLRSIDAKEADAFPTKSERLAVDDMSMRGSINRVTARWYPDDRGRKDLHVLCLRCEPPEH